MGATRRWMRWADLKVVGRSRSGSLTRWVDQFEGSWRDLVGGRGGSIGGWVRGGALASAWMCNQRGVHVREDGEYCRTV